MQEDNELYRDLMARFHDLVVKDDREGGIQAINIAQDLSRKGNVDPRTKEEIDSQHYVDLMGYYKKLSFEGKPNTARQVLEAALYLISQGNVSSDAAYAGAVL